MKEIEIKILDINVEEIRTKLLSLGAEKTFEGDIHAVFFDSPRNKLKNQGNTLRVRKIGEKTELCFKGKKEEGPFKIRPEIEVITNNFSNTLKILEHSGFIKSKGRRKIRESYQLNNVKFDIDFNVGIPAYLEIEAANEKIVEKYVKKLGFSMAEISNLSSGEVIKLYNEQKN